MSAREVNVGGAGYVAFLQDLEALVDHGIEEPNATAAVVEVA